MIYEVPLHLLSQIISFLDQQLLVCVMVKGLQEFVPQYLYLKATPPSWYISPLVVMNLSNSWLPEDWQAPPDTCTMFSAAYVCKCMYEQSALSISR